jgi:hypothetical protein
MWRLPGFRFRAKPTVQAAAPRQASCPDERWLADFPNDLGCLSLSSDELEIPQHRDEMGLVTEGDVDRDAPHLHQDCGF